MTSSDAAHRDIGEYAAARVDQLLVIGAEAHGIHDGAGGQSVFVDDNAAAITWLRENLRRG